MIFSKDVKFIQEIDQTIINNPFLESPVLNKGTTRAIFIWSGTVPELKDTFIMYVNGWTITGCPKSSFLLFHAL